VIIIQKFQVWSRTVLLEAEESRLANQTIEMVKIGHGCTREQVSEMVKRILDKDGKANLLLTRRDWWHGFL